MRSVVLLATKMHNIFICTIQIRNDHLFCRVTVEIQIILFCLLLLLVLSCQQISLIIWTHQWILRKKVSHLIFNGIVIHVNEFFIFQRSSCNITHFVIHHYLLTAGMQIKFLTGRNLAMIDGYLGQRPTLACLWHAISRFEGVNK